MSAVALIGLVSAKGSPGVTTTALALAAVWPRPVLLAECDPAGGDIAAGFLRGQADPTSTVLDLALLARRGLSRFDVLAHCLRLSEDDQLMFLAGLSDPAHVASTSPAWPPLAAAFRGLGEAASARDVLADCGRLDARGTPVGLLAGCDLVVVVLRPRLVQVHQARRHVQALRRGLGDGGDASAGPPFGMILVGDRPHPPGEVAKALGMPVLAVLPVDLRAAGVLSDGAARGRWFGRSALVRAARVAAATACDAAERADRDGVGPAGPVRAGTSGVAS